jgi:hypothetical protein
VLGTTLWNHCPEFYLGHLEATVNDYSLIMFPETPASRTALLSMTRHAPHTAHGTHDRKRAMS